MITADAPETDEIDFVQEAQRRRTKRRRRRAVGLVGTHGTLIIISALFLLPILWMIISSVKSNSAIFVFPPTLPTHPQFGNYRKAVSYIPFGRYFLNTVIVSAASVVGTLASGILAGYAFSIMRWRGRDVTFYVVLATIMLPFPVVMIPLYYIFTRIHWIGTLLPLIVPPFAGQFITPYFSSALAIFLFRQFFRSLPYDLVDAARVDGAGHWRILRSVIWPLSRGVILTVGIFTFLSSWTAFIGPLIFLDKQSTFTLSLGLQQYESIHFTAFNYLMAASTLFCLPVVVLFFFAQRYFMKGISFSGLKG
jgi:multiple sugar transport system permease protein